MKEYGTTDLVRNILYKERGILSENYFWKHAEENLLIAAIDYLKNEEVQDAIDLNDLLWMLSRSLEDLDAIFNGFEKITIGERYGQKILYTEKTSLQEQELYHTDKKSRICMQEYIYYKKSEADRAAMNVKFAIAKYCEKNFGNSCYPWFADISGVSTKSLLDGIYPSLEQNPQNEIFWESEKNMLAAFIEYIKGEIGSPYANLSGIIWIIENPIDIFFNGEYKIDLSEYPVHRTLLRKKTTKKEQREYLRKIRESECFDYYISFKKLEGQILTQVIEKATENIVCFMNGGKVIYA